MPDDFYKKTTGNLNLFGSTGGSTEPNMRQELINTFDGSYPEIAKSQPALLRKMRIDSNGKKIPCECVDSLTKEPDKDRFCPYCFGEGFRWDEVEIKVYRVLEDSDVENTNKSQLEKAGLINKPFVVFYIQYNAEITRGDKLVLLNLGVDGSIQTPWRRRAVFRVEVLWDYRADNGKLEYYKAFSYEESIKHLNAPSYDEV